MTTTEISPLVGDFDHTTGTQHNTSLLVIGNDHCYKHLLIQHGIDISANWGTTTSADIAIEQESWCQDQCQKLTT